VGKPVSMGSPEGERAISSLFEKAGWVLVEVRFPDVSSDFYLCETLEDLHKCLEKVAPGIPILLSDVDDLVNSKGALRLAR